jgi:hypothetical protein
MEEKDAQAGCRVKLGASIWVGQRKYGRPS